MGIFKRHSSVIQGVAMTMVTLLWLVTLGVPLSRHYCHGQVVSERIYGIAPSCGPMEQSTHNEIGNESCCRTETMIVAASGLESSVQSSAPHLNQNAVLFYSASSWQAMESVLQDVSLQIDPSPPLRSRDLTIQFQSFLI